MEFFNDPFNNDYFFEDDNKRGSINFLLFFQLEDKSFILDMNIPSRMFESEKENLEISEETFSKESYHNQFTPVKPVFNLKNIGKKQFTKAELKQTLSRRNQKKGKSCLEDNLLQLMQEDFCSTCKIKVEKHFQLILDHGLIDLGKVDKVHYKEKGKDTRILTELSKKRGAITIKQGLSKKYIAITNTKILLVFAFIICYLTIFDGINSLNTLWQGLQTSANRNEGDIKRVLKESDLKKTISSNLSYNNSTADIKSNYFQENDNLSIFIHKDEKTNELIIGSHYIFNDSRLNLLSREIFIKIYHKNTLQKTQNTFSNEIFSNTENDELIIKQRILFESMQGSAPYLFPFRDNGNNTYICYSHLLNEKEHNFKTQYTFEECNKQFSENFEVSKRTLISLLETNGIEYYSLPGGVRNSLIYMVHCRNILGWSLKNLFKALRKEDYKLAAKEMRDSFWGKSFPKHAFYNSFLLENKINTFIPSFLADLEYIKIHYYSEIRNSVMVDLDIFKKSFINCYKKIVELVIKFSGTQSNEHIIDLLENKDFQEKFYHSDFYNNQKMISIYEQINYLYFSGRRYDGNEIYKIKSLIENIFFFESIEDLDFLYGYLNNLSIKSDL